MKYSRFSKAFSFLLAVFMALSVVVPAFAATATPSTNDDNLAKGWVHFEVLNVTETTAEIRFTNPRNFLSCWEVRTKDQAASSATNPNTEILDGRWPAPPFTTTGGSSCLKAQTETVILTGGIEYFEIRSVFGGEKDERFTWTRVYLLPPSSDGGDDGSSVQSSSPNVCNMTLDSAPEWIPYGDANVELHWAANGCDVYIRSLDGGQWVKLSFKSRTYTVAGGWVGVLAPLPFGVSPGWNIVTMGTNSFPVWVGHQPPPDATSWVLPTVSQLSLS